MRKKKETREVIGARTYVRVRKGMAAGRKMNGRQAIAYLSCRKRKERCRFYSPLFFSLQKAAQVQQRRALEVVSLCHPAS